uniref:Uncharacterized protein n=1 Tax=Sphaerodactylus townsendi TaxID=933632 RepID=A0ACB8FQK7_9SAUR
MQKYFTATVRYCISDARSESTLALNLFYNVHRVLIPSKVVNFTHFMSDKPCKTLNKTQSHSSLHSDVSNLSPNRAAPNMRQRRMASSRRQTLGTMEYSSFPGFLLFNESVSAI